MHSSQVTCGDCGETFQNDAEYADHVCGGGSDVDVVLEENTPNPVWDFGSSGPG